METFSITSTVKEYPTHTYQAMKEAILGKRYNLSLVFIGTKKSAQLNEQYRQKTYSPNVLSFPLDERTGEIFICPLVAKSQAAKHSLSVDGYVAFLFIHGLLHLKGHDHGDTMDTQEQKYLTRFNIS
jgi:probable rRNA maturation factor